jgi:transcriptional regulator with XRE-family HTH domain
MTRNQYRAALERLGLTQSDAAKLLGVDPRTSRKWANGERPVDKTAGRFLTYLEETKSTIAFDRLMRHANLRV